MFFLPDTTQGVSCLLLPCPLHRLVLQLTRAHSAVCWFNLNSVRTIDSTFSKMFLLFLVFYRASANDIYFYPWSHECLFLSVCACGEDLDCMLHFLWILPLMVTLDISSLLIQEMSIKIFFSQWNLKIFFNELFFSFLSVYMLEAYDDALWEMIKYVQTPSQLLEEL